MHRIELTGMEFYARHGHFHEEQLVGNTFLVDVIIETDFTSAIRSDDLSHTIDYNAVYVMVKRCMDKPCKLIETVAGKIIEAIYTDCTGVKRVTVKVSKMHPQLGGKIEKASVVVTK